MSAPIERSGLHVTIVIPVYEEGEAIVPCLDRIGEVVELPHRDPGGVRLHRRQHRPRRRPLPATHPSVRGHLNTLGPGPALAIRAGIAAASADVVVVTMADGSDDPGVIDDLVRLVERGCAVAAASRYTAGGSQVGGPWAKGFMSRTAGRLLFWFGRVGTRDATNSFKAYRRSFVEDVGIESTGGFEIAIELVAKARRYRQPVAEVPTIWLDRQEGDSRFQLVRWLPNYLRWFRYAFGPRLDRSPRP